MSLPALEYCRAEYTEVWVPLQTVPLIQFADCVRSISSTALDLLEFGHDTRALELLAPFDSIVSWYVSGRTEFREAVRELPFTFHAALPSASDGHAGDFHLRQVGAPAGVVPVIDPGPVITRDFVAIHPFSGSPRKNWPIDRYRALAARLPLPCEFCAGPEEPLDGAVRFDSLMDVARWLAAARLYIGNDSGISHLAAAVGVPVAAAFRITDPRVWAPRGRAPVQIVTGDSSVEQMLAAALDLLGEAGGGEHGSKLPEVARHGERAVERDGQSGAG